MVTALLGLAAPAVVSLAGPAAARSETAAVPSAVADGTGRIGVIVRPSGASGAAEAAVRALGGTVGRRLAILGGFTAELPAAAIDDLGRDRSVAAVTPDASVRLLANEWMPDKDLGSHYMTTKSVNAQDMWSMSDSSGRKITGKGIGVAVIDSGISSVEGLSTPGKVINGPDLSFESQTSNLRHLDSFGHGTHMAGIIAGRDSAVTAGNENDAKYYVGVAPDAHLINMKVAAADGAVDVSQVIAAIDWVVQHRNDPGLNIRVLNLSFGTDSTQSYQLDPLAYAVEAAWRKGIVVVVSAGNEGTAGTPLNMPAVDPYVIAVGASDHNGTVDRFDDKIATFSSVGSTSRRPDLVAPGRSVVGLRTPGSFIDQTNSTARVTYNNQTRFFRGSGTSQAAAVVSGAAALVLQQRPTLTPDQVKFALTRNAIKVPGTVPQQGAGVLELKDIYKIVPPSTYKQSFTLATGTGSLEQSRGGAHVADPLTGTELVGEYDIMGVAWNGRSWAAATWENRAWTGGSWMGRTWSGSSWSGTSWASRTWAYTAWSGRSWSGNVWDGRSWSGNVWDGRSWSGGTWDGRSWSGRSWSGDAW